MKLRDICIWLLAKGGVEMMPSSLKWHYPLLAKGSFYKIALKNKVFFDFERESYNYLKGNFEKIKEFMPDYEYRSNYFKTDILTLISDRREHLEHAKRILLTFKEYGVNRRIELSDLEYIQKGLEIIKVCFGEKVFARAKQKIEEALKRNEFRIGPCHGDFHPKNVLKRDDKPVMIDFDCVRRNSIQEFDAIYFVIQFLIDYDGVIRWHKAMEVFDENISNYKEFFEDLIGLDKIEELKVLYFVDRIGQDAKYEDTYKNVPKSDIEDNLKVFFLL